MRTRTLVVVATSVVAAGIAFAFAACSDTAGPPVNDTMAPSLAKGGQPKQVKSISVSPSSATVDVGSTVQLSATASPPGSATSFAWASSNSSVATVSSSGLVTAVGAGTANISASAGGKSGSSAITVPGPPPPPPPPGAEILVGAGDIANCSSSGDEATANLLAGISGTVFTLGDNAYPNGSSSDYANCYDPSWGRAKPRTMPSPGNHEYQTANAAGYFAYFGGAAGDPTKGYYSYNLGAWHIIVLNSNSSCTTISCAAGSAQEQWLRADLAANTAACTLAYWHHPRFNSGASHGNNTAVGPFWDALYQFGAEIILNGHEHVYERFGPQRPNATADAVNGIRQFTVGTGGAGLYSFKASPEPNSEARNNTSMGVLKLTLRDGGYDWLFVPVAGSSFTDSGSGTCH
jgi:Big-like domain-containing protein/calcineurin-like phosphoesterase family protein